VLAKRPAIADFLVGEGALPTVANLVATGTKRMVVPCTSCTSPPILAHGSQLLYTRMARSHCLTSGHLEVMLLICVEWLAHANVSVCGLGTHWCACGDATANICGHTKHAPTTGGLETGDAAVTALWLLVRGNPRLLRPDSEALGVAGTDLVKPLREIILGSHSADAVRAVSVMSSPLGGQDLLGSDKAPHTEVPHAMGGVETLMCDGRKCKCRVADAWYALQQARLRDEDGVTCLERRRLRTARRGRTTTRITASTRRSCCARWLGRIPRWRTGSRASSRMSPRRSRSRSRPAALSCRWTAGGCGVGARFFGVQDPGGQRRAPAEATFKTLAGSGEPPRQRYGPQYTDAAAGIVNHMSASPASALAWCKGLRRGRVLQQAKDPACNWAAVEWILNVSAVLCGFCESAV